MIVHQTPHSAPNTYPSLFLWKIRTCAYSFLFSFSPFPNLSLTISPLYILSLKKYSNFSFFHSEIRESEILHVHVCGKNTAFPLRKCFHVVENWEGWSDDGDEKIIPQVSKMKRYLQRKVLKARIGNRVEVWESVTREPCTDPSGCELITCRASTDVRVILYIFGPDRSPFSISHHLSFKLCYYINCHSCQHWPAIQLFLFDTRDRKSKGARGVSLVRTERNTS